MEWLSKIVPNACIYIDSDLSCNLKNLEAAFYVSEDEDSYSIACDALQCSWEDSTKSSVLPCLSVRSAFDLLLSVKKFPEGSEMIMSAINISGMYDIARHHGLKLKPLDIDIQTMAPSMTHLKSLITANTKAVLVSHLYGRMFDIREMAEFCRSNDVLLIEDCAEAFSSISDSNMRNTLSDVKLFSFGTIKAATVFGGAICKIKDRELYEAMKAHQDTYPSQTKAEYCKKLGKYSIITSLFNTPFIFRYGTSVFRLFNVDHKEVFVPMLRGFPSDLFKNIRKRPSVALLNNLSLRFCNYGEEICALNKKKGDFITDNLPSQVIAVGVDAFVRNYWLFPILVEKPDEFVKKMNELGVDASRDSTQLKCIEKDLDLKDVTVPNARFLMDHVVYLPVHRLVADEDLKKVITATKQAVEDLSCSRLDLPERVTCKSSL